MNLDSYVGIVDLDIPLTFAGVFTYIDSTSSCQDIRIIPSVGVKGVVGCSSMEEEESINTLREDCGSRDEISGASAAGALSGEEEEGKISSSSSSSPLLYSTCPHGIVRAASSNIFVLSSGDGCCCCVVGLETPSKFPSGIVGTPDIVASVFVERLESALYITFPANFLSSAGVWPSAAPASVSHSKSVGMGSTLMPPAHRKSL